MRSGFFLGGVEYLRLNHANAAGAGAFFSSAKALSRGSLAKTPPCCFIRSVDVMIFLPSLHNNPTRVDLPAGRKRALHIERRGLG